MNEKKPRRTHLDERVLRVPLAIYDERMSMCKKCYAYQEKGSVCKIINLPVSAKTVLKSGACPMGFWTSYYGD